MNNNFHFTNCSSFGLFKICYAYLLFCSAKVIAPSLLERLEIQAGKSISSSYFCDYSTTLWCICLRITAALFPVISQGRTQCFTPFAAYELSSITQMQPLGNGIMKAPLQNP